MRLRDDDRGQSVQIGAVLLFAVLIIAFSSYQAFVVPQQNEEVEFAHNQQVHQEMQDLRNAVVSMAGGGRPVATSVTLGTRYPSRVVAQNPGPPSGTLRTVGTRNRLANLSVRNATADGETGDVWDGTPRNYTTGAVVYDPAYNRYGSAPLTVYEHSVLYNEFRSGTIVKANQTLVDGTDLSLVVLSGSLSRTAAGATTVDVRPVSSSTETVLVRAPDSDAPITLNFTSRLPASRWETLLSDQGHVASVSERPAAVSGPYHAVRVELEAGVTYRLQLTKVGVGSRVTGEDAHYLTDVDGEGATVSRGDSRELTLAVRDRYDNPIANVSVNGSVGGSNAGSLDASRKFTDGDGRATFVYETHAGTATGTHRVNFTTNASATLATRPFDQSRPKNVTLNVTVTTASGGDAVRAFWFSPTVDNSGGLSDCSADGCEFDVSDHGDRSLTLRAGTDPAFDDTEFQFRTNDSTVGTVDPRSNTTNAEGNVTTEFTAEDNGSVAVYFGSNVGDDVIPLSVTGVSSSTPLPPSGGFSYTDQSASGFPFDTIEYEFDWSVSDPNEDLDSVRLFVNESDGSVVDSTEIGVSGDSASGINTLGDSVMDGCGNTYTLTLIVSDQTGRTDTVSETDTACS